MMSEQLETYLNQLRDSLKKRGALDTRIVEEARAHLVDAVEDGLQRGLPAAVAEREALGRFGAPDLVAAHFASERHHMLNRILAGICWFTVLATAYLSLSVVVLRPPRLNYQAWTFMAGLFVAQSVVTLAAMAGTARGVWIRGWLLAGSVGLISVGAWWVHETLSGSHFEGHALVLGSLVAVQGVLTLVCLLGPGDFTKSLRTGLLSSTLTSVAFWMVLVPVLVVVAAGVWSVSTRFETPSKAIPFNDSMRDAEAGKIETSPRSSAVPTTWSR